VSAEDENRRRMIRWRLVLGEGTEDTLGGLSDKEGQCDRALGFLYGREYGPRRNVRGGRGGGRKGNKGGAGDYGSLGESDLSVPEWINLVHQLFPKTGQLLRSTSETDSALPFSVSQEVPQTTLAITLFLSNTQCYSLNSISFFQYM